jgi:hypothetical protein
VNALVDTAAQTGMRQWGKKVGGGSAKKEKEPVDLDTIVSRLRTSLPVMRAAQIDSSLRRLLLAQLVQQCLKAGDSIVIPDLLRVQRVTDAQFTKMREVLGGLTVQNEVQVSSRLQDIGVVPGAGVLAQHDRQDAMQTGGEKRHRLETRAVVNSDGTVVPMETQPEASSTQTSNMVQDLCASLAKATESLAKMCAPDNVQLNVAATHGGQGMDLGTVPEWAKGMVDKRHVLQWDSEQYVAPLAVG